MKNLAPPFILCTLLLFACQKENPITQDFVVEKTGNIQTFTAVSLNALVPTYSLQSSEYDHYFLSVFQSMFPNTGTEKQLNKSIWGQSTAAPFVESFSVNDIDIPTLEENYFNYHFDSPDSTIITNEPAATLDIDQQGDIPFSLNRASTDLEGFFPYVSNTINPHLANSSTTISKNGGTTLLWEADENNTLGVLILLFDNQTGTDKNVLEYLPAPDNGQYSFTSKDLENLSVNSQVSISFLRGNYGINADKILIGSLQLLHSKEQYRIVE